MNILMIGTFGGRPCGESIYNKMLSEYLRDRGENVREVCTDLSIDGLSAGTVDLRKLLKMFGVYSRFLINLFWADVIYITPGLTRPGLLRFVPIFLFSIMARVSYITHFHGSRLSTTLKSPIVKVVAEYFFSKARANVFLSKSIMSQSGIDASQRDNYVVIGNGVRLVGREHIRNRKERMQSLKLLYLGNLMVDKGVFDAIGAVNKAFEEGYNVELTIVGGGDVAIEENIKNIAVESECIRFLGPLYGGDKEVELADSDILLFPSRYDQEAYPLVVLEALAYSCVVLAYDVGAVAEIVGDAGVIVAGKTELSNNIKYMVENPRFFEEKASKSYQRSSRFGLESALDSLYSLIVPIDE